MKSKKKKTVFGGSRDIISGLPDALICHILSFLPTKEAASTTVLAKRWKRLLAFVPTLDFDDSSYFHPPTTYKQMRKDSQSFMLFVDSVLALQGKSKAPLNSFHVKCKHAVDQYSVLDWIPKVLKRGVLDIDLYIPSSRGFCSNSSFYPLPSKIFASKTLVKLKIQFEDGVNIDVEHTVSLPNLKTLHLDYFRIETSTFNKLLSGCHALEELVLVNLMWGESSEPEPCPVTVSIPTLKRLKFCRSQDFYEADFHEPEDFYEDNEGVSLSFDTPNLVYLEYSDAIVDRYEQVSFDSLVEANLRLRKSPDQSEIDKINVTKLLMGIHNVKILYLSDDTLKVLACCRETIPVFDNLIELTIKTTPYVGWKTLPPLLKSCPSLHTLVFEGLHHKITNRCGDKDGCLCKYDHYCGVKMDVRTCLSSSPVKVLKILKFGEMFDDDDGVDDDDDDDEDDNEDDGSCDEVGGVVVEQIEYVKHFLETMPDLEQVILYYNTPNDQEVMKVFKKLEKLPRVASANCNVQLKSNNLSLSSTSTKLRYSSLEDSSRVFSAMDMSQATSVSSC